MSDPQQFQTRMERIESCLAELERTADPQTLATSREAVRLLLELHAAGLAKALELARQANAPLIEAFTGDDLLAHLLLLHDLHPVNLTERVAAALAPFEKQAECRSADNGVVRVRLHGERPSCGASAGDLRTKVERAVLAAAPDAANVEIEDARVPPGLVPVEALWSGAAR